MGREGQGHDRVCFEAAAALGESPHPAKIDRGRPLENRREAIRGAGISRLRIKLLRVILAVFALSALFTGHQRVGNAGLEWAIKSAGYVLVIGGLTLRMWSTLYIGARKSKELVTEGPYSLCRNPLYVGTFAVYLGVSLCLQNLLMILLFAMVVVPIHVLVVLYEEKRLARRFPAEYAEYRRKVPRFRISGRHYCTSTDLTISTRALRRAAVETLGVVLIPPISHLIDVLQMNGTLPVLWVFP